MDAKFAKSAKKNCDRENKAPQNAAEGDSRKLILAKI